MELPSFICECESKSYSIPEIKLYSPPDNIVHVISEHLNEDCNYLVYNTKYIHSWITLMDYVCRQRLQCHIEYRLIYSLTKDIIDASIYDTSHFNYMADIDVYKIEDEEEFVPFTLEKYNIYLENYVEKYFKDLKGLPLGLSTNNAWDYSIHVAHKMFQYWLY